MHITFIFLCNVNLNYYYYYYFDCCCNKFLSDAAREAISGIMTDSKDNNLKFLIPLK
ncbi:hypothetical protein Lalb_Chr15g0080521 [Lupinus albus]|uniref:Uncharacterized protein n=1 Tax=Lupinus albus TaxID=3870 RepID=A0A6A4P8W6_LUPAL|nr:hypothetical protein Lalb_Chr15g0080521 [Lupinus albus]